ncbi:MAG: GcrA family cell cycle regulator [Thermaurantiacus sp.]
MAWTDERIELLKTYWSEGRSASQIAELLGEGLTRNAVIGKAHRLGLASRPSPVKASARSADPKAALPPERPSQPAEAAAAASAEVSRVTEPAPAPATPSAPAPKVAKPRSRVSGKPSRVTLLDLNDRICKWPIGHPDEADFHFCGKPVVPGFPYCGEHCALAYQAQQPRRDRPAGPMPPFRPNLPRPR